jgi:hypothetical protein
MRSRLPVRDPADRAVRRRIVLQTFPLRGLTSDNWAELSLVGKISTISGTWRCR